LSTDFITIDDDLPLDDFAVLASAADIVRYLRQHDDAVFRGGEGIYLVNGRFRETLEQLVQRANRIRVRRKLASYLLTPNV
jgi:hypothetical protein